LLLENKKGVDGDGTIWQPPSTTTPYWGGGQNGRNSGRSEKKRVETPNNRHSSVFFSLEGIQSLKENKKLGGQKNANQQK